MNDLVRSFRARLKKLPSFAMGITPKCSPALNSCASPLKQLCTPLSISASPLASQLVAPEIAQFSLEPIEEKLVCNGDEQSMPDCEENSVRSLSSVEQVNG